jgi:predicted AAA+ superfamily ATPase
LLDSDHDTQRWSAYVRNALIETVLSKDILLLTPITKPALFRQVFFLSCMHAGEILSLNKMLGQLQEAGNASTIASYLRLLEAAMLLKPLERYSGNRLRQKISSPKLLPLNNALVNATLQRDPQQVRRKPSLWGRLLENGVGASLVNNNVDKGIEVFYWRDREAEVDFVVRQGEEVLGIEVKTDPTASQEGLRAFRRRFPGAKGMTTALGGGDVPIETLIDMPLDALLKSC